MSITKVTVGVALVACAAIGTAVYQGEALRKTRAELSTSAQERMALTKKARDLEGRLAAETSRAKIAEQDTENLLKAVKKAQTTQTAQNAAAESALTVPITRDLVQSRFNQAKALVKTGDPEQALKELIWCFDVGMIQISSFGGVRSSYLLSEFSKLAERYPPALAALQQRRDRAREKLLAGAEGSEAAQTFTSINRELKVDQLTLALFDQLPRGDRQRRTFGIFASQQLLAAQRYKDVLEVLPYAMMSSTFEMTIQERPLPANIPNPEALRKAQRDSTIDSTVKNIEVLAGAGELANARKLAVRLLEFDGSGETRALILQHMTRAGQPDLLNAAP